jgi:hypothetical protein
MSITRLGSIDGSFVGGALLGLSWGFSANEEFLAMQGLTITPEKLASVYEYLRASPFCPWGLPHSDHVKFRVMGAKDSFGHFRGGHRRARGDNRCLASVLTLSVVGAQGPRDAGQGSTGRSASSRLHG